MPSTAIEKLTVEDYRAMPEGWFQLIEGEIHMSPSPTLFHQRVSRNIFLILSRYLEREPLGQLYYAPVDLYLDEENVFQPDLLYVSNGRLDILQKDGVHGAPDLVIEIVSPSNALVDKKRKRAVYARCGIGEFWLVDPILREVHFYDLKTEPAKPLRILEDDETMESSPFPGLAISIGDVFAG